MSISQKRWAVPLKDPEAVARLWAERERKMWGQAPDQEASDVGQ